MDETRILLANVDDPSQINIDTAISKGAYKAIEKALGKMPPQEVTDIVTNSGLRGRGGAGFVTGKKWGFLPKDTEIRYLVCNCDESEPGTFKDRLLVEKDPHLLIEGMILASYAIKSRLSFIYCRGEYFQAFTILQKAIDDAKAKGFLGENILGSGYSLDIIVHPGAGAYIAGEETAQLNSLEGYRATPRLKPPFPAVAGLYSKPTIVNNVETLCNVVSIVNNGAEWFRSRGTEKSAGTKIFQVSGHVQRPGCFEFPLGTPLSMILEAAGGMLPGRSLKAFYPGGSSCSLLTKKHIDIPMDFESLEQAKTALGTASIIVMDDSTDMVQVAHRLMQFYQNESCGKCTPCREGTRWVVQILERIKNQKGTVPDLKTIEQVCKSMAETSFCPLAVGAAPPILSAMREFPEEFQKYIDQNPAHERLPPMRIAYPYIDPVNSSFYVSDRYDR